MLIRRLLMPSSSGSATGMTSIEAPLPLASSGWRAGIGRPAATDPSAHASRVSTT